MENPSLVIQYLANPASHVLTFVLGMGLYHYVFALPERRRYDVLQKHVEELFQLQKDALEHLRSRDLTPR